MSHAEFLSLPDNVLWQRALKYYAVHDWFMVHEALEVLWNRSEGRDAEFFQALLQAAVSLYHYGNANFSGARQLAKSAISRLVDLGPVYHGVDLKGFLNQFEALMSPVMNNVQGLRPLDSSTAPKIQTA
jgi:predicted metal-dependent hydrolase